MNEGRLVSYHGLDIGVTFTSDTFSKSKFSYSNALHSASRDSGPISSGRWRVIT